MSDLVPFVIGGWPLAALLLFATMRTRRALIAAYLIAWMFLPVAVLDTPFVDCNKDIAASVGVLLGAVLFGRTDRTGRVRAHLRWFDLPILAWCLAPAVSSFTNGLGAYDMAATTTARVLSWGVPYLVGRLWLADRDGMRDLAIALFLGGLVYLPLCLYEIRMSPQLHRFVYGSHQHVFFQTIRLGGYRPMVFMQHGLMVGMFMATASLAGIGLMRARVLERLLGIPIGAWVALLVATTLMCQSFGALILLAAGTAILLGPGRVRGVLVTGLVAMPLVYAGARASGAWDGAEAVELVEHVSADRAASLQFRLDHERLLAERARLQPLFGWGGFGRQFPPPHVPHAPSLVSDSQWIISFGENGLWGLASAMLALAAPILAWKRRCRPRSWTHPAAMPGAVLAIALGLFAVDSMFNAMFVPVYLLAAGALAGATEPGALLAHAPLRAVPALRRSRPSIPALRAR